MTPPPPSPPPSPPPPLTTVGRYRVREVIGTGGFATVYRATDERLGADVAIKVLAENHSLDPEVRERFIEEARRLRRVRSPHLVTLYELGETDRVQPYLVLEWADRGDLARRVADLRRQGHVPGPDEVMAVARALAAALAALHRHDLVHRDLAPKNLLLCSTGSPGATPALGPALAPGSAPAPGAGSSPGATAATADPSTVPNRAARSLIGPDEKLVLADLGLSKDLAVASGFTVAAGTSGFAPPEQRDEASSVDHRADVWAAAAVIVWLVTDAPPDDAGRWRQELAKAGWPAAATRVLEQGLSPRPQDRPPTIERWLAELEGALGRPPEPKTDMVGAANRRHGPQPSQPTKPHRSYRRFVAPLMLVGALVLLAAGLAAWWSGRSGGPTVRTESLGGGQERTVIEDEGMTIELDGPVAMQVGDTGQMTVTVRGTDTWVWIGPDGSVRPGDPSFELVPRSAGAATVRLWAVGEHGEIVEARRDLRVTAASS